MDRIDEVLNELSKEILSKEEVKEFLKNKELLENNKELQGLRKQIAILTNENNLDKRDELIKVYNSNPLVINYQNSREEVIEILNSIKEIIN